MNAYIVEYLGTPSYQRTTEKTSSRPTSRHVSTHALEVTVACQKLTHA